MTFITILMWGEYLRGHFIFNFPWNLIGYGLYRIPAFLQMTSLVGIYGLTYFFLAVAILPILIWKTKGTVTSIITSFLLIFILAGTFLFGYLRIQSAPAHEENKAIAIQIIHPDISQIEKLESHSEEDLIQKYIRLTQDTGGITAPQTISIWPENSLSLYQNRSHIPLRSLTKNLPDKSYILMGAERIFPKAGGKANSFNSLIALNHNGNIIADYNKHILVPWGESLPYESIFGQNLSKTIFKNKQFTTAGDGADVLKIAGIPSFAPQICYETAYSGYTPHGTERPEFIVAVSNDNWAEYTTQPHQAFVQTQVRAIEEGLPILRSANKGISAIIDPYGRPLQQLGTDIAGTINGYLPNAIPQTFYAQYRDKPFLIFMGILTVIPTFAIAYRSKRTKSEL